MPQSTHMALLAILAIGTKVTYAAASLPYCQGDYSNTAATCAPFDLPGAGSKVDCNANGGNPRLVVYANPPKGFSSAEAYAKALQITNVFENGTPPTDYAICSNIGDGRGYTCGQGFTTDDGSALDPILRYNKLLGGSDKDKLEKYQATLSKNANGSGNACNPARGSTKGLEGFADVWKQLSCTDATFRQAQDASVAANVDKYAYAHAAYAGVTSDLGLLFFRDAMMQHGDGGGEPHIGMESIMTYAATLAPTPASAGKVGNLAVEAKYLAAFLESRRKLVCCYRPNGDLTWPKSADRDSDLASLLSARSTTLNLDGSITLPAYGQTITSGTATNDLAKTCKNVKSSNAAASKKTKKHNAGESKKRSKKSKKHHHKGRRL